MDLSDSRHGPPAVMCSRRRLRHTAPPLPCRVSQVPRLICPCALHPLTPGSPATAFTHCFIAGLRLHPIRQADHFLRVTRPKRFYLHCGSQVRLSRLRQNGSLRFTPDWLHVEWVIYMVSSFHLTRLVRLGLAHPINADKTFCINLRPSVFIGGQIAYRFRTVSIPETRACPAR